jgi:hypothetical protein
MTLPFSGPATPLGPNDITEAAASLGCDAAAVKAVITVEAGPGGGFLSDGSGRPKILFEAFDFSRATGGVYDATHPTISAPSSDWKLYVGGAGEYARLAQAMTLNPTAALASASWGLFQIMGNNFKLAGYESVQTYVTAMCQGEGPQLAAFVSFCELAGLARFLVAHDWASFALHYNGVLYKKNQYDTRLAAAWAAASGVAPASAPLAIGATGTAVEALQAALNKAGASIPVDGSFGQVTDFALMSFQASHSLTVDGIAGADTLAALGIPSVT